MSVAAILPRFLRVGLGGHEARPRQRRVPARPAPMPRTMARQAILTLENARLQFCVLRGCVWITRDGYPADIVLGPGEVFEQHPGAPVLVQALDEAEVLIAPAGVGNHNT